MRSTPASIKADLAAALQSSHLEKIASVVILFFLLCTAGIFLVDGWRKVDMSSARLVQSRELNARLDMAAAGLRKQLVKGEGLPDDARPQTHLTGESLTIAAAAFQATVLDILQENDAEISSAEIEKMDENLFGDPVNSSHSQEPEQQIDLTVVFDASLDELQKILFRVETGLPVMIVDTLRIAPGGKPSDPEKGKGDHELHVQLGLHGFWKAE